MPSYVGQQGGGAAEDLGVGSIEDRPNSGDLTTVNGRTYGSLGSAYIFIGKTQVSQAVVDFLDTFTSNRPDLRSIGSATFNATFRPIAGTSLAAFGLFDPIPQAMGNSVVLAGNGSTNSAAYVFSGSTVSFRQISPSVGYNYAYVNPTNANQVVAVTTSGGGLLYALSNDGGNTWSNQSIAYSGLFVNTSSFGVSSSALSQQGYFNSTLGEIYLGSGNTTIWQFRCANRVITWGSNSAQTATAASSSTSGYGADVGVDATSAVLGATGLTLANQFVWMKASGNNAFFVAGSGTFDGVSGATARYSIDGGVSWTTSGGLNQLPSLNSGSRFVNNSADASKFLMCNDSLSTITTTGNFGASFTNRSIPFALTSASTTIAWANSVAVLMRSSTDPAFITTNDFATITAMPTPTGITGVPRSAFAIGNRVCVVYSSGQIAITTDGSSFVVRSIKNYTASSNPFVRAASVNGRILVTPSGVSTREILFSSDDGVTWEVAAAATGVSDILSLGPIVRTVGAGNSAYFITSSRGVGAGGLNRNGGEQIIPATFSGAASYALSSGPINPIRTGATAYMRLA
jgi:hypothetical protein